MATIPDVRRRRILKDLMDFNEGSNGITLTSADNLSLIKVALSGPPGTPFETGTFHLELSIPAQFPFKAPMMTFTTKVWHPNISRKGTVCMDILDINWNSGTCLIEYAEAARALLTDPNPVSPLNVEAALLLERDRDLYQSNSKLWTRIHAGGSLLAEDLEEKLGILTALGLETKKAALKAAENFWDVQAVIDASHIV